MTRLRIVVAGELIGRGDHGGATWAMLQWVLGLRELGHDVLAIEPTDSTDSTVSARVAFDDVVRTFGLQARAAIVATSAHDAYGAPYGDLVRFARSADVLVNLSGRLRDPALQAAPAHRVYVDLDPAFTQIWHAQGADVGLRGHDSYVTVGARLDAVPDCGVAWRSTLPPVVLARWHFVPEVPNLPWTTVANLRSYGTASWDGRRYGQKVHSLRVLTALPQRLQQPVGIALRGHRDDAADIAALREGGWRMFDADAVARTPQRYERFVRRSFGEIGVAKAGYVSARCGWFSDRTAVYLASGRPAVVQDTRLAGVLPIGTGLCTFHTAAEAADAIAEVAANYDDHRRAARAIAEEHLDSKRVLTRVLDGALLPA